MTPAAIARVTLTVCLLSSLASRSTAQSRLPDSSLYPDFQLGGYVKYLFSDVHTPATGRMNDHLLHARLNGKIFFSEGITTSVEVRNRFYYGGSVEHYSDFLSSIRSDHDFANADIVWWNSSSTVGYSELDRLWLEATRGAFQLSLGRQRIAWGTALVWNPIDLFNPLSVLDFDYEERPGVDAVRLQYFSSEVTKIELAVKPGKTHMRRVIAGKFLFNRWNYDVHLLGGVRGQDPFVGVGWAGDISGGGFRGEVISRKIGEETATLVPSLHGAWSTSVVLSGDYTFTSNTYIHTEILFNNRGATVNTMETLQQSRALGLLSPARWSLFQELSFDLHPLVRVSGFVIYNPADGSSAWVPSVAWSALQNVDVSLFGLWFFGSTGTEYGDYGQSTFIRGKYSF